MIVEIVILAMIAAFLGLRLYAVLGRRPEQNEEPMRRRVEQPDPASAPRSMAPRLPEKTTGAPRTLPLPRTFRQASKRPAGVSTVSATASIW